MKYPIGSEVVFAVKGKDITGKILAFQQKDDFAAFPPRYSG